MWMIVDTGTVYSSVFFVLKILGDIRKCNIKRIFIYSFLQSPKEEEEKKECTKSKCVGISLDNFNEILELNFIDLETENCNIH